MTDETSGVLTLAGALGRRRWILLTRYPVDTLGQVLTALLLFLAVFLGGRALVGPTLGGSLGAVVVGYFLWTMAMGAYSSLAQTLTAEATWGTLEQLYVSGHRFELVVAVMAGVALVETFLWGAVLLGFMLLVTGVPLYVDPLTIVPLGAVTIAPVVGIGFAMGGLAVLYKRVGSLLGLLQFGFVALVAAPVESIPSLHALPMTTGTHLIGTAMTEGRPLWDLSPELLALVALKAAVFLGGGLFVLGWTVDVARHRGVLGQY